MVRCPECDKELKDKSGLAGHLRMVHGLASEVSVSVPASVLQTLRAESHSVVEGQQKQAEEIKSLRATVENLSQNIGKQKLAPVVSPAVPVGKVKVERPAGGPGKAAKPTAVESDNPINKSVWRELGELGGIVAGGVVLWRLFRSASQNASSTSMSTSDGHGR